jgi:hypothetical protein
MKSFNLQNFGVILIIAGTLGFLYTVIMSFTVYSGLDQGAVPAASFLSIILGFAFANPSMLQDSQGGLSTMRIIVLAVVLLFCTIYLKIGWSISKFEQFTIDKTWIYILGLAFGSKVFQKFGEEPAAGTNGAESTVTKELKIEQKESAGSGTPTTGKDTSADTSK